MVHHITIIQISEFNGFCLKTQVYSYMKMSFQCWIADSIHHFVQYHKPLTWTRWKTQCWSMRRETIMWRLDSHCVSYPQHLMGYKTDVNRHRCEASVHVMTSIWLQCSSLVINTILVVSFLIFIRRQTKKCYSLQDWTISSEWAFDVGYKNHQFLRKSNSALKLTM